MPKILEGRKKLRMFVLFEEHCEDSVLSKAIIQPICDENEIVISKKKQVDNVFKKP